MNLMIRDSTAEKIKEIGTAIPSTNNTFLMKEDIRSGTPKEIELTEDACEALPILNQILEIKEALNTPPELSADLIDMGLVLGGGALLKNIDKLISQDTGLPVTIADDPLSCVAIGTGRALETKVVLLCYLNINLYLMIRCQLAEMILE